MSSLISCTTCEWFYTEIRKPCIGKCGHTICMACRNCLNNLRKGKCPICSLEWSFKDPIINFSALELQKGFELIVDEKTIFEHLRKLVHNKDMYTGKCSECSQHSSLCSSQFLRVCTECAQKAGLIKWVGTSWKLVVVYGDENMAFPKTKNMSICTECAIEGEHKSHKTVSLQKFACLDDEMISVNIRTLIGVALRNNWKASEKDPKWRLLYFIRHIGQTQFEDRVLGKLSHTEPYHYPPILPLDIRQKIQTIQEERLNLQETLRLLNARCTLMIGIFFEEVIQNARKLLRGETEEESKEIDQYLTKMDEEWQSMKLDFKNPTDQDNMMTIVEVEKNKDLERWKLVQDLGRYQLEPILASKICEKRRQEKENGDLLQANHAKLIELYRCRTLLNSKNPQTPEDIEQFLKLEADTKQEFQILCENSLVWERLENETYQMSIDCRMLLLMDIDKVLAHSRNNCDEKSVREMMAFNGKSLQEQKGPADPYIFGCSTFRLKP